MTDQQRQRIHDIEYSCDSREELAERIVGLEDELAKWERLAAGIELPEYPITQFQPKDLERENAKLREDMEDIEGYDQMLRDRLRQETELRVKSEAENAKLRELLVGAFEDMNAWQTVIAGSNEWGYGKGCLECLCKLRDAMQELGMEVVV